MSNVFDGPRGSTEALRKAWYQWIGEVMVHLGSDASRMTATGENFSMTEEQALAANERFWEAE